MLRSLSLATATAFGLLVLPATAFAETESPAVENGPVQQDRIERLRERCREKGLSQEECREFVTAHRDRMRARAERLRARCAELGLEGEECRQWITEQREKRR